MTQVYVPYTIDNSPPEGTILINDGEEWTNSLSITLTISATDNFTVSWMRLRSDGYTNIEIYPWMPFTTTLDWELLDQGFPFQNQVVEIQFKDAAGNVSPKPLASDSIMFDATFPNLNILYFDTESPFAWADIDNPSQLFY
jgi:hypothetical protein